MVNPSFILWVVKNWKLVVGFLAVLSVLGAVRYYGHTKYRAGIDICESEAKDAIINENNEARKDKDNAAYRVQNSSDIDALLAELGILRP